MLTTEETRELGGAVMAHIEPREPAPKKALASPTKAAVKKAAVKKNASTKRV